MAVSQIISQVKRKNSTGDYDIYNIGPDLKYVGSLLASGTNNLEEEVVFGTDKIIKKQEQDNINKEVIEYRRESDANNYYIVEIDKFNNESQSDIHVDGTTIYLDTIMTAYNTDAILDNYTSKIQENNDSLYIILDILKEVQKLKYNNGESITLLATKNITVTSEEIDGQTVQVTREFIN